MPLLAAALLTALSTSAHSALVSRGGGMVYDTTLNITWLADMNYAKTSGKLADGLMSWLDARDWADGLEFGGYSDWRLPTNIDVGGASCYHLDFCLGAGSELGHLVRVDFGVAAGGTLLSGTGAASYALFSNIQEGPYATTPGYFRGTCVPGRLPCGFAGYDDPFAVNKYAVAVRDGDVGSTAAVPAPGMIWLVGLSLCLLAWQRQLRWPEHAAA